MSHASSSSTSAHRAARTTQVTPAGQDPTRPRVGLRTLVPYLRNHTPALVTVALLSMGNAAGTLAQPLLIRNVLDAIGAGEPYGGLVVVLVTVLVAVAVLYGLRNFLLQRTAEGLVLSTREKLAGHLLRLPVVEYDQRRTGDLLSRVGADTTLLRTVVTSGLLELASGVVIVGGAAIMMVTLDPLMFLVTMVSMVGLVGGLVISRRVRGVSEEAQGRVADMTAAVERAIDAVRTIRASRAEEREATVVTHSARAAYQAGVRMARLQALVGPLVTTVMQAAFLAVLGIGGARVATGAMSVGDLVAFVMFLFLMMMPIGQAMQAYTQLQAGLGALQRIEEILALPTETGDDRATTTRAGAPEPAAGAAQDSAPALEFDRVDFGYAGGPQVLHQVSFTVPYGGRTALVGPSGAGKSTLLTLAERFYDVDAGTVLVDGADVRDQPRSRVRARLGYVEQEAPVLAGTLRDNLLLTAPDAGEEQLRDVLATVNLADLADRTPDGLDAQVGEGGVLLSGGERQRLALARTLLAGAPILLLDEPTSNLDARNEQALRQAIDAVAAQRTLLVVAHRLATVADSDQIVVLDRGRVAATGTHHELTEQSPLYREFASHQLLVDAQPAATPAT